MNLLKILKGMVLIALGRFYSWRSRNLWASKFIPKSVDKLAARFIANSLPPSAVPAAIQGLRKQIEYGIERALDKGIEVKPDEVIDALKRNERCQILMQAADLSYDDLRQILEDELFLAKHRRKYKHSK